MIKAYIETGTVTGTHGVRGELRVQPWCDSPEDFTRYRHLFWDEAGRQPLTVTSVRAHKSMILLKVKGIDSVEQAETFRGRTLYVDRKDLHLQKGRYLIADLLGCRVTDSKDGTELGILTDVSATGANDVWHITRAGREYLIPAIPDVIHTVNVEAGEIVITPLKGIFEDED